MQTNMPLMFHGKWRKQRNWKSKMSVSWKWGKKKKKISWCERAFGILKSINSRFGEAYLVRKRMVEKEEDGRRKGTEERRDELGIPSRCLAKTFLFLLLLLCKKIVLSGVGLSLSFFQSSFMCVLDPFQKESEREKVIRLNPSWQLHVVTSYPRSPRGERGRNSKV